MIGQFRASHLAFADAVLLAHVDLCSLMVVVAFLHCGMTWGGMV